MILTRPHHRNTLWRTLPIAVFALGLGLRLFQLGADGFWFDEIGVARAIEAPTLDAMFGIIRQHVTAMPMDYFVGRAVAQFCATEACLRLPSAIWGALTLLVSYRFFRRFVDQRVALLGMLLLALTPLHVYYSQELRFYASLVFFYLASTDLLLAALEQPTRARWIAFTVVTIIGVYFHIYVALGLATGFFWLVLTGRQKSQSRPAWPAFITSALIVLIAYVPGYLLFASRQEFGVFSVRDALVSLPIGLGWLPNQSVIPAPGWVWYGLGVCLPAVTVFSLTRRPWSPLHAWTASSVFQIGFILALDYVFGYYVRARQFLWVVPLMSLLTALGVSLVAEGDRRRSQRISPEASLVIQRGLAAVLLAALLLSSVPALSGYYQQEKSRRREISQVLIAQWKPGDVVLLTPEWETEFYRYYVEKLGRPDVAAALTGLAVAETSQAANGAFLITPRQLPDDSLALIDALGFRPYPISDQNVPDAQRLWVRRP